MSNLEAGEKIKKACIDKLQQWSELLAKEGEVPMACVIWDCALQVEKEVVIENVLANG